MRYKKKFSIILELITEAKNFGVEEKGLQECMDLLEHGEFGLSVDHLATQIFEYDTPISASFFQKLSEIAKEMKMDESEYAYIAVLIK
jgi:hypothetical protein